MTEKNPALTLLESMDPPAPEKRLLQSWKRGERVLTFCCGNGSNAVHIGSDGNLIEGPGPSQPTKLLNTTVIKFLGGAPVASPLTEIQETLKAHLHFADVLTYTLVGIWIIGTYFYSIFNYFGYLFLHSLEKRCGKTRTAEVVSHLAFESTRPLNAPTPPAMRQIVSEGGTAIFDTLERWKQKDGVAYAGAMDMLDAGFRNGGQVAKMVPDAKGDWRLEHYEVYTPYVLAAINRHSLPDTALDRSLEIQMVRKKTRLKKRPYNHHACDKACAPVREKLYLFALTTAPNVAATYESEELEQEVGSLGLTDRAADIWKPLFAIAKVLGDHGSVEQLRTLAQELSPDPDRQDEIWQLKIASGLRTVAGPGGSVEGTTQDVIGRLREIAGIDCEDLHKVLTGWGFSQKSMRLTGYETPRHAWVISDEALAAIERQLSPPPSPPESATTKTTSASEGETR